VQLWKMWTEKPGIVQMFFAQGAILLNGISHNVKDYSALLSARPTAKPQHERFLGIVVTSYKELATMTDRHKRSIGENLDEPRYLTLAREHKKYPTEVGIICQ